MEYTENKTKLMDGDITAQQIVAWGPTDFLNELEKLKREEAEKQVAAQRRGDWARAEMSKKAVDGFFECRKCKLKKTSFYQMQTRGSDEPMTNFINCHNCGHAWKE